MYLQSHQPFGFLDSKINFISFHSFIDVALGHLKPSYQSQDHHVDQGVFNGPLIKVITLHHSRTSATLISPSLYFQFHRFFWFFECFSNLKINAISLQLWVLAYSNFILKIMFEALKHAFLVTEWNSYHLMRKKQIPSPQRLSRLWM